ncbi:MmcQ/YjbR family DNA-binding protein [Bacteroidota bacterium]
MNIEEIREYCISKKGVTEGFPFDEVTLVFKVMNKMFAIVSLDRTPTAISLKCDPERAVALREEYEEVQPGYHLNKQHWNTIEVSGALSGVLIRELIDHSYELIVESLTRKLKEEWKNLS